MAETVAPAVKQAIQVEEEGCMVMDSPQVAKMVAVVVPAAQVRTAVSMAVVALWVAAAVVEMVVGVREEVRCTSVPHPLYIGSFWHEGHASRPRRGERPPS